ncbi:RluA family pseudouridine synthase [Treponema sp.]|uniref:RluA family pseudouridine synthase n=1 Tax=Treponema sp. TaxID=166 RepID=UPI0038904F9C
MFPPFSTEIAEKYSHEFMTQLKNGSPLSDINGMFGILVCACDDLKKTDAKDDCIQPAFENEYVVLRAFSGQYNSKWNYEGFVPALVEQNQYDKIVAVNDRRIHELSVVPEDETQEEKQNRDAERLRLCNETLSKIYSLYKFTCADGMVRDFDYLQKEIKFQSGTEKEKLLPTGTGDCCAPKLLSYAFSKNLIPVSMTEFYWGKSNLRCKQGVFYPPCDEKCRLILPSILGLEILYRDDDIIVVDKPSGLLAVPGRGEDKQDCIVSRVRRLFPDTIEQPSVHRLDMDTSGLMVLAFTADAQRKLSMQFEQGKVNKKYIAVLDGALVRPGEKAGQDGSVVKFRNVEFGKSRSQDDGASGSSCVDEGRLELKFRLDVDNRPHQIYDPVYGKTGITLWRRLQIWKYRNRDVTSVEFTPLTGRTHQLRLAASDVHGFGIAIVGDNLYGHQDEGQRLLLHSTYISFEHPTTGKRMEFTCEPDFKY